MGASLNNLLFLVDDDDTLRKVLERELTSRGFEVLAFPSTDGVLEAIEERAPQVVLLDLRLPSEDGMAFLRRAHEADLDVEVVVLTGHGSVEQAVEAMQLGAHDFLTKPVRLDVLEQTVRRVMERGRLVRANRRLRRAASAAAEHTGILGKGTAMRELLANIQRVAVSESSVLIIGENGTGKELVARNIHRLSPRSDQPFVVVDCAAIPANLVESELFGHEKGAFTGASRRRIGLFEAADCGTLFLDELGDLPPEIQPALLRALQFGEIRPVGSPPERAGPAGGRRERRVEHRHAPRLHDGSRPRKQSGVHGVGHLRRVQPFVEPAGHACRRGQAGQPFPRAVRGDHDSRDRVRDRRGDRALPASHGAAEQHQRTTPMTPQARLRQCEMIGRADGGGLSTFRRQPLVRRGEGGHLRAHGGAVAHEVVDDRVELEVVGLGRVRPDEPVAEVGVSTIGEVHREERRVGRRIDVAQRLVELDAVDQQRLERLALEPDVLEVQVAVSIDHPSRQPTGLEDLQRTLAPGARRVIHARDPPAVHRGQRDLAEDGEVHRDGLADARCPVQHGDRRRPSERL